VPLKRIPPRSISSFQTNTRVFPPALLKPARLVSPQLQTSTCVSRKPRDSTTRRSRATRPRCRSPVSSTVSLLYKNKFLKKSLFNASYFLFCPYFRGALLGARQGDRSRRRRGRLAARRRSGSAESGADGAAVGEELRRGSRRVGTEELLLPRVVCI